MGMLDKAKTALRISQSTTSYDAEIADLIEAARHDLKLAGVLPNKADSDEDSLIRRALMVYVKANFGWDNPDSEKLNQSYLMIKNHLLLSQEYTEVIVINVISG